MRFYKKDRFTGKKLNIKKNLRLINETYAFCLRDLLNVIMFSLFSKTVRHASKKLDCFERKEAPGLITCKVRFR